MAQLPMSVYLGTPEPKVSPFGRPSGLFAAEPTTFETVSAFVQETFIGEGSLSQDIQASNIRKQERRGDAISEDDWKTSDNFRSDIKYYDTMTNDSAGTLARLNDDRNDRNLVISKASKLQTALGFGIGFLSGVVEPKNLITGIIAALATGGAGVLVPSIGRMIAVNTVKGAAIRGGVEGVVAASLTEPSNLESSKIVQGDYTMADSIINVTLGSILGAGLGGGVKAFQLRGAAKTEARGKELSEAYRAETDSQAVKEMDTALSQTVQGVAIEVGAVKQADAMQAKAKAVKELPKIEEKIAAKQAETGLTPVTQRPEFKKWFEGSRVGDANGEPIVVFHGTDQDIKQFNIKRAGSATGAKHEIGFFFTSDPKVAGEYAKFAAETSDFTARLNRLQKQGKFDEAALLREDIEKGRVASSQNIIPAYLSIKNPLEVDMQGKRYDPLSTETGNLIVKARVEGRDGVILTNFDDGVFPGKTSSQYIALNPEQIKSKFNRGKFDPNDPRLIDIDEAEALEVKRGQALSDASQPVDAAPIQKLQDQVGKPDNSTAYDPRSADAVTKEVEEFGNIDDQIALERELEDIQEQVSELLDQGLLTKDEIATIEKLAAIDEESAIFDNVLLDARLCLTRG